MKTDVKLRDSVSHRAARVLALAVVALLGAACENRQLSPSPDARSTSRPDAHIPNCANVGCAAPPLCSVGCQAGCGCCGCVPGTRDGDLVCTEQFCYAPAPASDAGGDGDAPTGDAGRDGGDAGSIGGSDAGSDVCALPFEAGPCEAAISVYAFVNGACVKRTYGGCQGNGNRFSSWEECVATCVGPPNPGGCPPNRIDKEICLACGPAGGCSKMATVCTLVCSGEPAGGPSVCEPPLSCYQGVCQVAFCI